MELELCFFLVNGKIKGKKKEYSILAALLESIEIENRVQDLQESGCQCTITHLCHIVVVAVGIPQPW